MKQLLKQMGHFALLTLFVILSIGASMPILMDDYNDHPNMTPKYRDKCTICHVYEDGSGP